MAEFDDSPATLNIVTIAIKQKFFRKNKFKRFFNNDALRKNMAAFTGYEMVFRLRNKTHRLEIPQ